jgi:hypothetical protein
MPVEGPAGHVATTAEPGDLSSTDGAAAASDPEDEMSISSTGTRESEDSVIPDRSEAVHELEQRLRQQVAQNAKLDTELRYLLEELAIRKEFVKQLENELETAQALTGRQLELVAEFTSYRERLSHRAVDRLVDRVYRLPWLYRPLKLLSRLVLTAWRRASVPPETT